MRKLIKIFVITVVLLLPVLVFLFLKQFGSNEFTLPVYYASGNPLEECRDTDAPHKVSNEFFFTYNLNRPLIAGVQVRENNEYQYDLLNVLEKYPSVQTFAISPNDLQTINCELIIGEDHYINEPIINKYVLIDSDGQIRGYFQLDDLDEIQKLDMELDILLNY